VTEQDRYELIKRKPQPHFGRVHAFYAIMGGFAFYESYGDGIFTEESLFEISTNPRHNLDAPTSETLVYIMKYFPHIITDITEESILDRAGSSDLSKVILIVQVGWFCTNCASRLIHGLPLSLLEVSTAAHAFCTLLTYFVWLSKPINVAAPTIMREKQAREVYALVKCSEEEYDEALEMARKMAARDSSTPTAADSSKKINMAAKALLYSLPTPERPTPERPTPEQPPKFFRISDRHLSIPGTFGLRTRRDAAFERITWVLFPVLYGLIHFLAWGDHFPTPLERLLWRVCSSVVTCSGLVGFAAGWILIRLMKMLKFSTFVAGDLIPGIWLVMVIFVYFLASCFLIVESFRQLFYLNPAAFQLPSWSNISLTSHE
jgi:hypothetical protein